MTVPPTLENNLILAYKGYFRRTSSQGNNVVSHRHDSRGEQHKVPKELLQVCSIYLLVVYIKAHKPCERVQKMQITPHMWGR